MPLLIVRHSSGKLERFELDEGDVRVGRGDDCELRLPNVSVSRLHCTLSVGAFGVTVHDAESQNGLLVNGEPTDDHTLQNGDSYVKTEGWFHWAAVRGSAGRRGAEGAQAPYSSAQTTGTWSKYTASMTAGCPSSPACQQLPVHVSLATWSMSAMPW